MCMPNGSGHDGTCQCESLFGFHGPSCQKLSAASFLLMALSVVIILHSIFALYVSDCKMSSLDNLSSSKNPNVILCTNDTIS